jgi:hypothetical protein
VLLCGHFCSQKHTVRCLAKLHLEYEKLRHPDLMPSLVRESERKKTPKKQTANMSTALSRQRSDE